MPRKKERAVSYSKSNTDSAHDSADNIANNGVARETKQQEQEQQRHESARPPTLSSRLISEEGGGSGDEGDIKIRNNKSPSFRKERKKKRGIFGAFRSRHTLEVGSADERGGDEEIEEYGDNSVQESEGGDTNGKSDERHREEEEKKDQEHAAAGVTAEDHLEHSDAQIDEGPPIGEIVANGDDNSAVSDIAADVLEDHIDNNQSQMTTIAKGSEIIYKPEGFDVCFDDRTHPGTKEWLAIVRGSLEKFADKEYSPPVYKAIKKQLKGRRFLIRISQNPTTSWREATKPEVIEIFGECFNEQRRRLNEGLPLNDDELSEVDDSLQDSARQSEESLSVRNLAKNRLRVGDVSPKRKRSTISSSSTPPSSPSRHRSNSSSSRKISSSSRRASNSVRSKTSGVDAGRYLHMAIKECEGAQEYARPYDDVAKLQKGIAAEQKLAMLLNLSTTPPTAKLKKELVMLDDLLKRMRYASMAPLLETLQNIEKHMTEYFQSMTGDASMMSLQDPSLPAVAENDEDADVTIRSQVHSERTKDGRALHNRTIPVSMSPTASGPTNSNNRREKKLQKGGPIQSAPIDPNESSEKMHDDIIDSTRGGKTAISDDDESDEGSESADQATSDDQSGEPSISNLEDTDDEGVEVFADHHDGSTQEAEIHGKHDSLLGSSTLLNTSLKIESNHEIGQDDAQDDVSSVGKSETGREASEYSEEYIEEEAEVEEDGNSESSSEQSVEVEDDEPPNPKVEHFFDRLQHFFEVRRKVQERASIMDPSEKIRNLKIKIHSGSIVKKNGKYKKEYQQHSLRGKVVRSLDDLYDPAKLAHPTLTKLLEDLVQEIKGFDKNSIVIPPLKPRDRAYRKAREEYGRRRPGPGESWLYDVVRTSVICKSYKQISDVNKWLGKRVHIIKSKNRFANPAFNGYRDLIYHVSVPIREGLAHTCEIQVHHRDIKALDDQFGLPKHLEFFRPIFAGSDRDQEETLADLEMLNELGDIGGRLMSMLLKSDDIHQLNFFANICREKLDEFDRALEIYRRLLAIQESEFGSDHESVAATHLNIGLVLSMKGENDESLVYMRNALEIQETSLGTEHAEVAESYTAIGDTYLKLGNFDSALSQYRKALKIRESKQINDYFLAVKSLQNIGNALLEKGDFKGSVMEFTKALKIQQSMLGDSHTDVADSHALIGTVLCKQGDFDRAMEEHRLALNIKESDLGKNHVSTAKSHSDIGIVVFYKGDYEIAEWRHRKSLRIREAMCGKDHDDCAASHANLGLVLSRKGDYEKALKEVNRALKIRETNLGRDHPLTASTYIDLGDVLFQGGAVEEALEEYRRAMVIRESVLGENHPITAASYMCIGKALNSLGKYDRALAEHNRAIAVFESVLGPSHPDTATGYHHLADTLMSKGNKEGALIEHRKALAIRANVFAKDHPDTAVSCTRIGTLLYDKGDLIGALVAYRQALAIYVGLCGEEHPDTASAHVFVGRVLTAQEDFDDALEEFRQAASIREVSLGEDHIGTAYAYSHVATVLSMLGRFPEAVDENQRCHDILSDQLGKKHAYALESKARLQRASRGEAETDLVEDR